MKISQLYDFLILCAQGTKMKFSIGIEGIAIEELENSIISNKFVRLDVYGVLLKNNESYGVKKVLKWKTILYQKQIGGVWK